MHIVVNGEQKEVLGSPTILNLLKEQEVASPDMVSVQLKGVRPEGKLGPSEPA